MMIHDLSFSSTSNICQPTMAFHSSPIREMKSMSVRLGFVISLHLLVGSFVTGCVGAPLDETVIASRSTPVGFTGYMTSELNAGDDAATAARPFHVSVRSPVTGQFTPLGAAAYPSSFPEEHGIYDWHEVSFGERVIPLWAWATDPTDQTRWHAQLSIRGSGSPLTYLFAFTAEEMPCYLEAIEQGGNAVESGINCGGDFYIDLYVNK